MIEHGHCAGDNFFGTDTSNECHTFLPLQTAGLYNRFNELANLSDIACFHLHVFAQFLVVREIAESPYGNARYQNGCTHLLQILFAFFPSVTTYALHGRHTVWRQFHNEWAALAFDDKTAEHLCHENAEHDANQIHTEESECRMMWKEG